MVICSIEQIIERYMKEEIVAFQKLKAPLPPLKDKVHDNLMCSSVLWYGICVDCVKCASTNIGINIETTTEIHFPVYTYTGCVDIAINKTKTVVIPNNYAVYHNTCKLCMTHCHECSCTVTILLLLYSPVCLLCHNCYYCIKDFPIVNCLVDTSILLTHVVWV